MSGKATSSEEIAVARDKDDGNPLAYGPNPAYSAQPGVDQSMADGGEGMSFPEYGEATAEQSQPGSDHGTTAAENARFKAEAERREAQQRDEEARREERSRQEPPAKESTPERKPPRPPGRAESAERPPPGKPGPSHPGRPGKR